MRAIQLLGTGKGTQEALTWASPVPQPVPSRTPWSSVPPAPAASAAAPGRQRCPPSRGSPESGLSSPPSGPHGSSSWKPRPGTHTGTSLDPVCHASAPSSPRPTQEGVCLCCPSRPGSPPSASLARASGPCGSRPRQPGSRGSRPAQAGGRPPAARRAPARCPGPAASPAPPGAGRSAARPQ